MCAREKSEGNTVTTVSYKQTSSVWRFLYKDTDWDSDEPR